MINTVCQENAFSEIAPELVQFENCMQLTGEIYKQKDNRCTLRFEINGTGYFIKQHTSLGRRAYWQCLKRLSLSVPHALNEVKAIEDFHDMNIPTLDLASYGEQGTHPADKQSFLITKALDNTLSLETLFSGTQRISFSNTLNIIKQLAEISRTLHGHQYIHRDFYLCHFLVDETIFNSDSKTRPTVFVIDLHRAQKIKFRKKHWQIKELGDLYFSTFDTTLTQKDYFRFLKHYFQLPLRTILNEHQNWLKKIQRRAQKLYRKACAKNIVRPQNTLQQASHEADSANPADLTRAGLQSFTPSDCHAPLTENILLEDNSTIHLTHCLRVLPNRRCVFQGSWQGNPVIVKCFFHAQKAKDDLAREIQGLNHLQHANILTPAVLYHGHAAHKPFQILVTAFIPNAKPLGQFTPQSTEGCEQATQMLANLHQAEFIHQDCHLNNFLVQGQTLYMLDGDAIVKTTFRQAYLDNLALWLSQFNIANPHATFIQILLTAYDTINPLSASDKKYITNRYPKILKQRAHKRKQKINRTSSEFVTRTTWRQRMLADRTHFTHSFDGDIPNLKNLLAHKTILKRNKHGFVASVQYKTHTWVIKYHRPKGIWATLRQALKSSRGARCWHNSHLLRWHQLHTPKPIAMIEEKWGPFKLGSYFISEFMPGPRTGRYLRLYANDAQKRQQFHENWKTLYDTLGHLRLAHRDLKPNNIIVHHHQLYLIDLDAMRTYPKWMPFANAHRKDLTRWQQRWQPVTDTQYDEDARQ